MAKTMRRRSSKGTRKAKSNKNKSKNSWPMFVKKVYHEEHKKNTPMIIEFTDFEKS